MANAAFGTPWTDEEIAVTIESYWRMLNKEFSGQKYVKTHENRTVQRLIGRTHRSIESKYMNVSAVLRDLGVPYIPGYRPYSNVQQALREAVESHWEHDTDIELAAHASVQRGNIESHSIPIPDLRFDPPPEIEFQPWTASNKRNARRVDFLQVEASNRSLGLAGELAVVQLERKRLEGLGRLDLASAVEHSSVVHGDGLGYDIKTFADDGSEKFVEVKTTRLTIEWPFHVSRNELRFSRESADTFSLYRVFAYGQSRPGYYELPGPIDRSCSLSPTNYQALPA